MIEEARAFAPASVSNVACGFDVLGFAIEHLGDTVIAKRKPGERQVAINDIRGDIENIPSDWQRNTAGLAAREVLDRLEVSWGVELEVIKGLPSGTGLGSSAASAVAAALATNLLADQALEISELLSCCLAAEETVSGRHADNVAPALLGGMTLVRSVDPEPDVVQLPTPPGLSAALILPAVEIETRSARAILPTEIPLADATRQWANVGALVAALYRGDTSLLGRALEDRVAEPHRRHFLPQLDTLRRAALSAGALGCSFSGSGPALFALCANPNQADLVADAWRLEADRLTLPARVLTTSCAAQGARECSNVPSAPVEPLEPVPS